jgi:hypothetical protein
MATLSSGRAKVGWGGALGSVMRLVLQLTPSALGSPLTDMTTVTAVSVLVRRGDGKTTSTWVCSVVGSPSTSLATWAYTYGANDLTKPEMLTCTALLTTPGGVIPTNDFLVYVED